MIECKAVVPADVGQDVLDRIDRDLTAAFGGLHKSHSVGLWCDPDQGGRVIHQPTWTYNVAVQHPVDGVTFQRIIEGHCREAGERYLYVAVPDPFALATSPRIVPLQEGV